jgi:hypothetical protein
VEDVGVGRQRGRAEGNEKDRPGPERKRMAVACYQAVVPKVVVSLLQSPGDSEN